MLFSSIPFLYYFLPLTLLCYFLAPRRAKNAVLLLFSLVFYAWGEPKYVLFMVVSILQGYFFGRLVEKYRISNPRRSKLFLTASVLFSLLLLGYCKYADFFIRSFNAVTGLSVPLLRVALPIGISFYTFQILSYVVDVHRGTVAAQRNLIDLGTYIAMFPQLIAGPIVRYADIEPQLKERRSTPAMVAAGAQRFVLGLGKKVLIANVLYQLITVYKLPPSPRCCTAGCTPRPICCTSISIFPVTAIWPSAWGKFSASPLPKTSIIPISPAASPNFGGAGT